MIFKQLKNQEGVSLLEIVIVVLMFTILLASSASLLSNTTFQEDLEAKAKEVTELISRARNYATTAYFGDDWGIKVLDDDADCDDDGVTNKDCIILFKGNSYSSRDKSYDEKLELTSSVYIDSSEENEFYFNFGSGWLNLSSDQGITLRNKYGDKKYVTTTPVGLVFYGD